MPITEKWLNWTRANIKNGASAEDVQGTLKQQGFSDKDIKYALKKSLPKKAYQQAVSSGKAAPETQKGVNAPDYQALANPRLVRSAYGGDVVPLCQTKMQLFTIPNFLKPQQCEALIEIIRDNAFLSQVDGYQRQSEIRSSRSCALVAREHPLVAQLDDAISKTMGLNLDWAETNQGQWYEPGQEYKPHPDYFPPGTDEYEQFAKSNGQRTWTFMIYLNNTKRGGATHFPKIRQTVSPEQGRAVCWNNLLPDGQPNPATIHAGLPVEEGSKFIVTKWFRDRGKGAPLIN